MKHKYKIGQSVAVNQGIKDPDFGHDIGGWQGRIIATEVQERDALLLIEWDSKTVEEMPRSVIDQSEKKELDWSKMHLYSSEVAPAKPRDDRKAVIQTVKRISKQYDQDMSEKEKPVEDVSDNQFLWTYTGDPFQLARIHYEVHDRAEVKKVFLKLRCMEYDPGQKRWVWLFQAEAKKLKLPKKYSEIPKEKRPIVLGSFFSLTEESMYMNTNSFERVTKAIVFFDQYLGRSIARAREIEILNKLFPPFGQPPKHADFFDNQDVHKHSPEDLLSKIKGNRRSIFKIIKEAVMKPLPEIERIPIHFYEDGIDPLETILKMNTTITHQHWLGNKNYSAFDFVRDMISS